jgi:hypothetical protein
MEPWQAILIGAAGTWLIAVIAIWDKFLSSWLFRPSLRLGAGEFSGTLARHQNSQSARYYLLPVENRTRIPPAHEVQLMLTRLEKSGASGLETLFDEILPLPWARQELYPLLTRTIGTSASASLFFVQQDGLLAFTPALTPCGELLSHFPREHKAPITLWITLRAVSIEADSPSLRLKIEWNGQWRGDKVGLSAICTVTVDPVQHQ